MSVPDQYMARLGANVTAKKFLFSAGLRIDGIPAKDLVGGSNGFRRPGYIISAEPGVSYRTKRLTTFLNAPIAFERNRIQSVPDKKRTAITKSYYKGDAAFADYVVNLGVSFNLFKQVKTPAKTEQYFSRPQYTRPQNNDSYRNYYCPRSSTNCQKKVIKL
jgi:hypothetical protein